MEDWNRFLLNKSDLITIFIDKNGLMTFFFFNPTHYNLK